MEEDPKEVVNLALNSAYRDVVLQFREQIEEWQRLTADAWLIRDGVSLLEMQGHIDAGLKIPDRLDFDVSRPAA